MNISIKISLWVLLTKKKKQYCNKGSILYLLVGDCTENFLWLCKVTYSAYNKCWFCLTFKYPNLYSAILFMRGVKGCLVGM